MMACDQEVWSLYIPHGTWTSSWWVALLWMEMKKSCPPIPLVDLSFGNLWLRYFNSWSMSRCAKHHLSPRQYNKTWQLMSFLEFQRALGAVMFLSEMRPKKECKPEVMATLLQLLACIEQCIDRSNPSHLQFLIAGNPRKIAKDNLSGLLTLLGFVLNAQRFCSPNLWSFLFKWCSFGCRQSFKCSRVYPHVFASIFWRSC